MKRVQLKKKPTAAISVTRDRENNRLSIFDRQFVTEYLRDYNATKAYIRAGGPLKSAGQVASLLLKRFEVQDAVHRELAARRARSEATLEEVCGFHYELATADPRNLTPFKNGACRHCWGEDHGYQRTEVEARDRLQDHLMKWQKIKKKNEQPPMLDPEGGSGFDCLRDPMRGPRWRHEFGVEANSDHDCPACQGIGQVQPLPLDLASLTYGETLLYNGIKINRDGSFEVRLNSRTAAMEKFAELRGFVRPRLPVRDFDWDKIPDDALDAAVEEALRRGLVSQRDLAPMIESDGLVDVTPGRTP